MTFKELLTELAATIAQNGIKVSDSDKSLPANTNYSPDQVTAAIRHKLLTSGYKITQPLLVKTAGGNRYTVVGEDINLIATFDNTSGKIDLFQGQ